MKFFLKNWLLYLGKSEIRSADDFKTLLRQQTAGIAGRIVMGYSQNRLGKKHHEWSRDKKYSEELMKAQITIHQIVISDLLTLICDKFSLSEDNEINFLKECLINTHQAYLESSPEVFRSEQNFTAPNLEIKNPDLKEITAESGKQIYAALPLTEIMEKSNVQVFQGQIRLYYINLLEKLCKRISSDFFKNHSISTTGHS